MYSDCEEKVFGDEKREGQEENGEIKMGNCEQQRKGQIIRILANYIRRKRERREKEGEKATEGGGEK